jgi:hypothetical protein
MCEGVENINATEAAISSKKLALFSDRSEATRRGL